MTIHKNMMCKPDSEKASASGANDNAVADSTTEDVDYILGTYKPTTTLDATDSEGTPTGKNDKEEPEDVVFLQTLHYPIN